MSTAENHIKEVIAILANISEDQAIPRNIRRIATQSIEILQNEEVDIPVRAINAIELLEDATVDSNCPYHARTLIWQAITRLEFPVSEEEEEWEYEDDDDEDDDEYEDEEED